MSCRGFEYTILLVIFLNTVAMAMYDYSLDPTTANRNLQLDVVNKACTIIYAVEAGLKILAMGFVVHSRSYLREVWNFIDFFIVACG